MKEKLQLLKVLADETRLEILNILLREDSYVEKIACELSLTRLRAFSVGEVTRGVAERESVVCRDVACTEARTAEGGLDYRACAQQICGNADLGKLERYGNAGGIYRE